MARYLITGATGFIGGHVAERLARDNHQLRCLVRETSRLEILEPLGAELVYGSITDRDAVESAVEGMDVVMHVAGMTSAQRYQQMLSVNRDGSWHVARACASQARPPVLVVVSSIAAAGPVPRGRVRSELDRPIPFFLPSPLSWLAGGPCALLGLFHQGRPGATGLSARRHPSLPLATDR